MPIGILACVDSVLGGIRSHLDKNFNFGIFISGFFGNGLLSMALFAWIPFKYTVEHCGGGCVWFKNYSKILHIYVDFG